MYCESNIIPSDEFINQMPGLFVVLDSKSRFITGNITALKWTGFTSKDAMMGATYGDMPCKASEQHENFIAQDKIIFQSNKGAKIFGLYCYDNDEWKVILAEKYFLKNHKHEVVALASYITDLTHSNVVDINKFISLSHLNNQSKLQQTGFFIGHQSDEFPLTSRQSECLFFLLRGKAAIEIAMFLNLSRRTVEIYCEQLKEKFNCETKSQLIEKTISLGYLNRIPKSLFNSLIN